MERVVIYWEGEEQETWGGKEEETLITIYEKG